MLWTKSEHNVVDAIWRDLFANATRCACTKIGGTT
jgi:hypothetical protein